MIRNQWVKQALEGRQTLRNDGWSESIAVGSLPSVETVKNDLGIKAMRREALEQTELVRLREPAEPYARKLTGRNEALSLENTLLWNESLETQVHSLVRPAKKAPKQS